MLQVKSLADTIEIIRSAFSECVTGAETIRLAEAAGRVLASEITAKEDNPPFARSSLDGYAIRAEDTFGAGEAIPAMLSLAGEVRVNEKPQFGLKPGQAVYIPTGGCLPANADAVAMIEIAEVLGDQVLISSAVAPGTGIVFQGEDAKSGEIIIKSGQKLAERHIGALAALGYQNVEVKKKIKCAVISTGDELFPIDEQLTGNGKAGVRDVNSHLLKAQAESFGCEAQLYGICRDDEFEMAELVQKAHEECDVVLLSGGSSAGVMDLTKLVFQKSAGADILIHGIAIKPGKPTIIAKAGGKALIGLPGHPVSAFFVMISVVAPLLEVLNGLPAEPLSFIMAKLADKIPSNHGREDFVPVRISGAGDDISANEVPYKSGLITLLSGSDGYIRIPRLTEGLDAGVDVKVYRY